jgi:hypothetical protein
MVVENQHAQTVTYEYPATTGAPKINLYQIYIKPGFVR